MLRQYSFILLLLVLSGCDLMGTGACACSPEPTFDLEVHLTSNYDGDRVRIEIDGREVFDDRVTTEHVLSLAEIIRLQEQLGRHRMTVYVNRYSASKTIDLDRPLYVQVSYFEEAIPSQNVPGGITITVLRERPLYD